MFVKKTKEIPYKDSKEFLDKQQKIDYLLVLVNLNTSFGGIKTKDSLVEKCHEEISKTIDQLK